MSSSVKQGTLSKLFERSRTVRASTLARSVGDCADKVVCNFERLARNRALARSSDHAVFKRSLSLVSCERPRDRCRFAIAWTGSLAHPTPEGIDFKHNKSIVICLLLESKTI